MKASVVCLLFASLLVIVLVRGNEGHTLKKNPHEVATKVKNFNEYDENKDGYISLHEFRITGSSEGFGEVIYFLFESLDKDKDEQLNLGEFRTFAATTDKRNNK